MIIYHPMIAHLDIILNLVGSLGLFLFSMEFLASTLKKMNLETLKTFLLKSSKTPLRGVFSGTIVTGLLGSSSVVIVLLIAFVDSQLISFSNSLAIVLGANIGTTISSQIIAIKVGDYASIGLLVGTLCLLISKNEKIKMISSLILGVSMIFFSLHLMDMSVAPLKNSPEILNWMTKLDAPLYGILIGGVVTFLIQSSSATIGIAITMASQGLISLDAGIAVMLGAEIGTCTDTLICTIGRSRDAVRIGFFHLFYNIFSVAAGYLTIDLLKNLVLFTGHGADVSRQIAHAHLFFNLGGALFFLLLIPLINRSMNFVIPPKRKPAMATNYNA